MAVLLQANTAIAGLRKVKTCAALPASGLAVQRATWTRAAD